jgi:hypothetical protein
MDAGDNPSSGDQHWLVECSELIGLESWSDLRAGGCLCGISPPGAGPR